MTARWPDSGPVDETLVKASQYIMDAAHDFRVRLKALLTPKKVSNPSKNCLVMNIKIKNIHASLCPVVFIFD